MKLLYLSLLTFVLVSTSALAMSGKNFSKQVFSKITPEVAGAKYYPDLPTLKENSDSFPVFSAQSVMAVDMDSGVTLYEKDPLKALFPASTTKIVTALVVLDNYDLEKVITVGKVSTVGQKMGLNSGEKITVRNLLNGLLIYSANDAAEVLADNHPNGRQGFITDMNKKVKSLGLVNTNFSNPSGLDDANQYSNVRDLVTVAKVAMQNPLFADIVGTRKKIVTSIDGKIAHNLVSTNELLGKVEGVKGVKTGWTEAARENLVTYIERNDKKIMIAVLGSQDRFGETEELINWIFENYEWEEVKYSYSP